MCPIKKIRPPFPYNMDLLENKNLLKRIYVVTKLHTGDAYLIKVYPSSDKCSNFLPLVHEEVCAWNVSLYMRK